MEKFFGDLSIGATFTYAGRKYRKKCQGWAATTADDGRDDEKWFPNCELVIEDALESPPQEKGGNSE